MHSPLCAGFFMKHLVRTAHPTERRNAATIGANM